MSEKEGEKLNIVTDHYVVHVPLGPGAEINNTGPGYENKGDTTKTPDTGIVEKPKADNPQD